MTTKAFEADDPMEIVGTTFPDPGGKMMEEMGKIFVDEFFRMGMPEEEILKLFRDPFYQAAHALYRLRGEAFVTQLIADVRAAR